MYNGRIMVGISVFCLVFVTIGGAGIASGNFSIQSTQETFSKSPMNYEDYFRKPVNTSSDYKINLMKSPAVNPEKITPTSDFSPYEDLKLEPRLRITREPEIQIEEFSDDPEDEIPRNIEKLWELGTGSTFNGMKTLDSSYFGFPILFFVNSQGFVNAAKFEDGELIPLWRSQNLGDHLRDIEIGDVDGDKDPELVVSHYHQFFIFEFDLKECKLVWESQEFGTTNYYGIPDISLGDTNGDGMLEICIVIYHYSPYGFRYDDPSSIFLSDLYVFVYEKGSWEIEWFTSPMGELKSGYRSIAIGDIFKGGGEEIVVGGLYGIEIYSFQESVYSRIWTSSSKGDSVSEIAIGDINGDQKNDLVTFHHYRKISVYRNYNERILIPIYEEEFSSAGGCLITDLTGDDCKEIVIGGNPRIHILSYDGENIFQLAEANFGVWALLVESSDFFLDVNEFLIYDRNRDDFYVMTLEDEEISILFKSDLIGVIKQMEIGNFYGDGEDIFALMDHRRYVYFVTISGERIERLTFEDTPKPTVITSGDYDGDGKDELAYAYFNGGNHPYVYVHTMAYVNGEFTNIMTHNIWSKFGPGYMVSADFHNDGTEEIALATKGSEKDYYYDVVFDDGRLFIVGLQNYVDTKITGYAEGMAVDDTDGDGNLEIIHKGYKTYMTPSGGVWYEVYKNELKIIGFNNGEWVIEQNIRNYPINYPNRHGVSVGDFDNNGSADILSQNDDSWSDLYEFNGEFYVEINDTSLEEMGYATAYDFNGDGIKETVASNDEGVFLFDFSLGYEIEGKKLGELAGGIINCYYDDPFDLMFHLDDGGYLSVHRFV
jgi:hypothetical protein